MKKSIYFVFLAICCSFLLMSCNLNASTPPVQRQVDGRTCQLKLRITVRQGVHANQTFAGTVDFKDSASISGSTLEGENSSDPISFYFDGPAMHFMLETNQGQVFGTGLMESGPATCNGTGGGTQSGPAEGDLGDWRGEWVLITKNTIDSDMPAPEPQSWFNYTTVSIFVVVLVVTLLILVSLWLLGPYNKMGKKLPSSKKTGPVQKSDQKTSAGALVEYSTTYTQDDLHFDLSFPIENASEYLGEYGINIAKAFGVKSDQVIAFEIWMFDKNGSQSASKILMSEFAYGHDALKKEMELKGQVIPISPKETVQVETASLRLQASILEVEYDTSQPNPRTIFKKVVIKIGVWPKSS